MQKKEKKKIFSKKIGRADCIMIGPVVCLSCNRRLGRLSELINEEFSRTNDWKGAFENHAPCGVSGMCCRRMLLTCRSYVNVFHNHDDRDVQLQNITCLRHATKPRKVQCI
jgi:DNA-directed RNA polymerase subunit N (RpoN/RPB10)